MTIFRHHFCYIKLIILFIKQLVIWNELKPDLVNAEFQSKHNDLIFFIILSIVLIKNVKNAILIQFVELHLYFNGVAENMTHNQ